MFPQIAKKKKKDFIVDDIITKQWEQALRDLQIKSKMALKRIPNSILQDYGKVCRIKSIPEFYADYFICSTYKLQEQQLSQVYAQEIQRILTNSSYFHKINQALRQREELIEGLKNSLIIVEGFLLMNQNKSIPLQIKTSIDSFVNDCATLEEIKDLQRKKTEQLAKDIIRIRTNTTQLLQLVGQWRQYLLKYSKNQKKLRMIYPHQAINCLLMPLYDLLFLKNSILRSEVNFGKDQHDPFLQKMSKSKKGTQIQNYFLDYLKADTTDYSSFVNSIIQQLPSQQSERLREKQLQIQRKKEQKLKQQQLKQQKLRLLREQRQKQIRIKHSTSLKTFKPIQKEQVNRNANSKTSKGQRSQRKIINIDKLMKQKSARKKVNQSVDISKQKLNDNDSKVLGAYKKMKKKDSENIVLDKTELILEKKNWEKQIKQQKQQKQKIRKLLRQTEKKAIIQTKQFEQKLKRYQQQVQNLKNRVDQSKKIVRVTSSLDKSKGPSSPQKVKKIIISAYKSQTKPKESELSVLQQKLLEESKSKQNLEKQIKELTKEKIKIQKLMERQSTKAVKEVQTNKRKIEKYQEIINKLKNETESSHRKIHQLESSKHEEQKRNAQASRNSIVKQKQIQFKKKIQQKIQEKDKRKSAYSSIKLERPKIIHQKKKSMQKMGQKMEQSLNSKTKLQTNDPKFQVLKEKLQEQSRLKRSLQTQIKQLAQQKIKLQKFIEKQSIKANKEGEKNNKRIEKYEQTINRLKKQTQESRRMINQIESSKIFEQKKNLEKSRVQSVKKKQDELRRKIQQKIQERQIRKAQKAKAEQLNKSRERRSNLEKSYKSQVKSHEPNEDIQIIKTKQTIEIVFEPKKRKSHQNKQLIEAESKLIRLQKQRDLLQRKLQLSRMEKKQKTMETNNKKINQREQIAERFKNQIQREREKNFKLEQNLRKMRKNINNQYELKLNQQKMKYQRQREQLLKVIEKQRQEKRSKDKILQQQMSFLRQMQKKQNQLFELLEHQKRQKLKKEQILTRQIQQKQELMSLIELQEIKKGIERQVRKQIQQNQYQQNDEDILHQQRKLQLQQEIEHLRMEKQHQIQQMNDQNEKLKDLIAQIKVEETNLLQAIKENIQMESDTQKELTDVEQIPQANKQLQQKSQSKFQDFQKQNQLLSQQLQSKTMIQFRNQQRKKKQYASISNSQVFKDKQKIESLVQFYLNSPHKYPGQGSRLQVKQAKLQQFDKKQLIQSSAQKAKQIQKFQAQLFSVRDLPQYVPTLKNDSITNHLLNLRDAYDDYEADALRRQLFPPLQEEVYQQKQLSYESEYPMNTLMDHVRDHMRNHPKKQQKNKKNFLAINRVRLAVLEQNRKEKQRVLIEQQSKRKIQRQLFDKRRKQRQQNFQREKQKQLQQNDKKREEIYKRQKKRAQKQARSLQKKKQQKLKKLKNKEQKSLEKQKTRKEKDAQSKRQKSKKSDSQSQSRIRSKDKKKQTLKDQSSSDSEGLKSQNQKQKQQKLTQQAMQPIKEQQSLQQKQAEIAEQVKQYEEQLKNRQRDLLKEQIKQVQQEVRTFINQQQHYSIYQQFINENQLLNKIQQLLDLSSQEIQNLNGNLTIKEDVPLYSTLALLVAKNSKGIQVGLGVFHKQLQNGEYVCDYLIAHNMQNFLNLAFNFSRYLFKKDIYSKKIEFIFNIKSVTDPNTLKHFLEFEKKCRRLGEVYLKARAQSQRKYVLKRSLFQAEQQSSDLNEIGGINFKLNLALCGQVVKQINQGFVNKFNPNYSSYNVILAYYLSKKEQKLTRFKERAESQLLYRELLVTSLLFQKKEVQIKNFTQIKYKKKDHSPIAYAQNKFDLHEVRQIQQMKLAIAQKLPQFSKRCTLQVGLQPINYLLLSPQQAITIIQSSNSSQTGYFLSIVPKYKLMIIEAEQFLTMSSKNRDLTAFFYIKHFIKNIVDVKKEKIQRIYLPQIHMDSNFYFPETSKKLKETMFLSQTIEIGWKTQFPNSVIYTPRHQDLVIQRPFIVALLSGNVERAVQGSPICVEVIM